MIGDPPSTLTVDQYHRLIRAGVFTDDDRVELLEGNLVRKARKSPPHSVTNAMIRRTMELRLPAGFHFTSQDPVTLADGEPEPDGAVVCGQFTDYRSRHPRADEVPLIIEIADTSLNCDRGIKLRSYARAGIAVYWIINLTERAIEVYTDPDAQAPAGPTYRQGAVYAPGGSVPLMLAGAHVADVPVSEILL